MPNLVGTGLNQVPTNSMLGGLAYQDPEHASIKDLDLKNLSQINSEIADTAVDVFVYDTRKDSDGGAWRKKTQDKSWYNETLGTSTRGTRKEFPAVAVIVAESNPNKVTIYDGDDPDLPMWMVFNVSPNTNANFLSVSGQTLSSISMLNGDLCVGFPSVNGWGISRINFLSDSQGWYWTSAVIYRQVKNLIAERNLPHGYIAYLGTAGLVNARVNDIAMTVLPNAPIDTFTELPVPTVALATDGGVCVIKDDGTVVDLTYQESTNNVVRMIDIDSTGRIYWSTRESTAAGIYFHEVDLPAGNSSAEPSVNIAVNQAGVNNAVKPTLIKGNLQDVVRTKDRTVLSLSGTDNKGHLNLYNVTGDVNSSGSIDNFEMVDISTDYNTGYIIGDIKGAFLSDTDTTDAIEYVQNGYFNSDVSSWTIGSTGTTATLSSNRLLITAPSSGPSWGYVYQAITTEIGKTYKVELHYDRGTVDGRINVRNDSSNTVSGALFYADLGTSQDGKTYWNTFTATATTTYILLYAKSTSGGTSAYDRVSVTLEKDRSVVERGLRVYGTITKTPVATGADLVGYSGWTTSNFLVQSYNSEFDLGTGDFCIALWTKKSNTTTQVILERGNGSINVFYLYISNVNDIRFSCGGVGTNAYGNIGNSTNWHQIIMVRRSGNVCGYIDGKLASCSSNPQSVTSTDSDLYLGKTVSNQYPFSGSIALVRISGSAPSEEQIKKMYVDEKMLFQDNAKATLYGSSDNVTAIAYDDSTNLLYAGTSLGRSDFQGLCRINNTTTAVTTAISASNGFIAEQ